VVDGAADAVDAGLAFLRRQQGRWTVPLPDAMPVAIELLLPYLLEEATAQALPVSREPYGALIDLGAARRRQLQHTELRGGTPVAYSWESWGTVPEPALLDTWGSVGLSPAATAAWIRASRGSIQLAGPRAAAEHYLQRASTATPLQIPNIVGVSWPIDRFEQAFGLYALLLAGLLDYPPLQAVVRPQLDALAAAVGADGIGFSDEFAADGDDTAVALCVLAASGYSVDWSTLTQFKDNDHFCAWQGELHPAPSVTAHAIHALAYRGLSLEEHVAYLLSQRQLDGRWPADKWHTSWLYTTAQAVIALHHTGSVSPIATSLQRLASAQNPDGGWGTRGSTAEETAYALYSLRCAPVPADYAAVYRQGVCWLNRNLKDDERSPPALWLSKEAFRPDRIVRIITRAALLRGLLDEHHTT
jgi:hypothetical protein